MGSAGCKLWWPLIPEVEPDQHEESQWVTPFFPNFHLPLCTLIPHVLHWSCPKDYQSSFPRSELVCPSVPRWLSPESSAILISSHVCYLFSDWVMSCHVSSGCYSLCMTYDWVWLSLPYYFFLATLPSTDTTRYFSSYPMTCPLEVFLG